MFLMVQNVVLPFWKLLAYVCQMIILETLVSLMLTSKVETALLLSAALWQKMPLTVILIFSVDV